MLYMWDECEIYQTCFTSVSLECTLAFLSAFSFFVGSLLIFVFHMVEFHVFFLLLFFALAFSLCFSAPLCMC